MIAAPNDQGLQRSGKVAVLLAVIVVIIGAIILFRPANLPDSNLPANNTNTVINNGDVAPALIGSTPQRMVPTLAIIPFVDESAQRGNAYLASGMAEELVSRLTKDATVRVTTRPYSLISNPEYSVKSSDLIRFEAGAILQGTTRKNGDQIEITLQLTEAISGKRLWANEYQLGFSGILALTDEIKSEVVHTLAGTPNRESAQSLTPTVQSAAYQPFLQGRHFFHLRGENLIGARAALEEATQLDPQFANAWAYLAATLLITLDYIQDGTRANTRAVLHKKAKETADQAVKLDNANAVAHAVLGKLASSTQQWVAADESLSRAIALDPYDAQSRQWRGDLYLGLGHTKKARDDYAMATSIDPLNAAYHEKLGYALLANADYQAAEESIQQALEMRKQTAILPLAFLRMSTGERTRARELMERYVELLGYSREGKAIALYLESIDGEDRGNEVWQVIKKGLESGRKFPNFVILLATLGQYDEALELAGMQNLERVPGLPAALWLPNIRPIVQRPAFLSLAERMGFNAYWRANGYPDNCSLVDMGAPRLQCNY